MTALGLVMETMLRIAGPLFFPFFLMFCELPAASIFEQPAARFSVPPLLTLNPNAPNQGSYGTSRRPSCHWRTWTDFTSTATLSQ